MLTAIVAVTLTAPDLHAAESAYTQFLEYRVVERGEVSNDLAAAWGAPLIEGRKFVLLQPASGAEVYLRLVQSPTTPGYEVMRTHGWNSNEILCQDPDAMAERLAKSPFRVVGPPRNLSSSSTVRAMQAIGPAEELIYLTRIPPSGGVAIKTPALSFVDRTFIVVLGGADMQAMRRFYADRLGLNVSEARPSRISVLNHAWNRATEAETPLALALVSPGFAIELDQYPTEAKPRPQRRGDLPPGLAMVSFTTANLDAIKLPWLVAPQVRPGLPYQGRRAALAQGAAGEWIEIIEGAAPRIAN
jgi:catechol 2,3-dioxygenase-like lactoylglutathione lyase family enzyme